MKKIQVYSFVDNPLSIEASSGSHKPNSLVEYPIDVKGDDEKMIEYGNEMISMWTFEVQGLQEKKELKDHAGDDLESSGSRQTFDVADRLKVTLQKEMMNQPKKNKGSKENNHTGLIRPALMSKMFDINKTIATKLFGDNNIIKPNIKFSSALATVCIVSATTAYLALWNFIALYYIYSIVLVWPFLLYWYTVLVNIDIAKIVLRQQQIIVYIIWCFVFYITMLIEFRSKDNYLGLVVFWTTHLFGNLLVPSIDSITNIDIRMVCNKLFMPSCMLLGCLQQIAMYFNWSQIPESSNFQLFGHINMSITALASSSANNIMILIGLNIFSAYMYPHSLIMIKSRVEAVLMSEEEAVALRAMDQIGNETAEANKQQDIIQVMTGKIRNTFSSSSSAREK